MPQTSRSEAYRASAMECATLAEVINNPRDKAMLLIMAESWLRLADYVEQRTPDQLCENHLPDIRSEEDPKIE